MERRTARGGSPSPRTFSNIVRPPLLEPSSYFFVALTDDTTNVWRTLEREKPKFLPFLPEPVQPGSVPPVMDWSPDRNSWATHRENFGWIGFRDIEPLVEGGEFFCHARQFLDAKRRFPVPCSKGTSFQNIRTRNWNEF